MSCDHKDAVYGCEGCVKRVRSEMPMFPLQMTRSIPPGPLQIPWEIADLAWAAYAATYGKYQSVERLAQRGGFSWGEMDMFYPDWRAKTDVVVLLKGQIEALSASSATMHRKLLDMDQQAEVTKAGIGLLEEELDAAKKKAATFEADWYAAKSEFGTAMSKAREATRAAELRASAAEKEVAMLGYEIAHLTSQLSQLAYRTGATVVTGLVDQPDGTSRKYLMVAPPEVAKALKEQPAVSMGCRVLSGRISCEDVGLSNLPRGLNEKNPTSMEDEEFLNYVWAHSESERHLFHQNYVIRLLRLADVGSVKIDYREGEFYGLHDTEAKPLVELARKRLNKT